MTRAIQLTAADTSAHNLYALILEAESVTQLPQRVDLGAVFFPDFVNNLTITLPLSQAGNSGQSLSIQDPGSEITSVLPGIPFKISGVGNSIALQGLKIQATAIGVVTDVFAVQN